MKVTKLDLPDWSRLFELSKEEKAQIGKQLWAWLWEVAPAPICDSLIECMGKEMKDISFTDTLTRNIMKACGLYNSQKVKEILDASN